MAQLDPLGISCVDFDDTPCPIGLQNVGEEKKSSFSSLCSAFSSLLLVFFYRRIDDEEEKSIDIYLKMNLQT